MQKQPDNTRTPKSLAGPDAGTAEASHFVRLPLHRPCSVSVEATERPPEVLSDLSLARELQLSAAEASKERPPRVRSILCSFCELRRLAHGPWHAQEASQLSAEHLEAGMLKRSFPRVRWSLVCTRGDEPGR